MFLLLATSKMIPSDKAVLLLKHKQHTHTNQYYITELLPHLEGLFFKKNEIIFSKEFPLF